MSTICVIHSVDDARATHAVSLAFDMVCKSLQLPRRDDLVAEVVANKIVQLAAAGERDPLRLHVAVMRWVARA